MLLLSLSLSLSSFSRTKKSSPLHSFTPLLLSIVRSVATQTHNNNRANANNSLTARPTTPEECVKNFQDTFFCKYLGSPTLILLNTKDLLFFSKDRNRFSLCVSKLKSAERSKERENKPETTQIMMSFSSATACCCSSSSAYSYATASSS